MHVYKRSTKAIRFIIFCLTGLFLFTANAFCDSAKEQYLKADECHQKLNGSESLKKKENEWLVCISRYENIHRLYPDSSWAPAGLYKAAQLSLNLAKISGKSLYQDQATDLLLKLRNKYPKSAYDGTAKNLLKSVGPSLSGSSAQAPEPEPEKHAPKEAQVQAANPKISKKEQTKNNDLIQKYIQKNSKTEEKGHPQKDSASKEKDIQIERKPEPEKTEPPAETDISATHAPILSASGDSIITDLRVWSNPEYTRIVVNVGHERAYSHKLLNKDPDINKPFERLYVDVEQTKLGRNLPVHTPINDNLLIQARAGQFQPHTVRVVVDIKSFENYKVFSLKDPFRIVIDVWGKGSNGGPPPSSTAEIEEKTKPKHEPEPAPEVEPESGPGPQPKGKKKKSSRVTTDNLQSSDIARQLALGVRKIIIDPGHGGSDPGAPGYTNDLWEKEVVLKMAHKLAGILKTRLNCSVLLTRDEDKKLTLEERTAIANTKRGDLFISLHCNAAKNKDLKGIETYFLNLATDKQAIAVAARENATSEKNISDLDYILSDLMKNAKIEESTRLANIVHQHLIKGIKKKYSDINDLGVKQAPFYVLLGARMPSILIETSFISNKIEAERLMDDAYQKAICESIADGVEKYIETTNPKHL